MRGPSVSSRRFGQRYFEGYTFRETLSSNGKTRRELVYTGIYYSQNIDPKTQTRRRVGYAAAWFVSLAAVFYCGIGRFPFLNSWWGALSVLLFVLLLLLTAGSFYTYSTTARPLTAYRYYKVQHLLLGARVLAAAHLLCAALMLLGFFRYAPGNGAVLLGAALHLAAAFCQGAVAHREARVTYTTRRADATNEP